MVTINIVKSNQTVPSISNDQYAGEDNYLFSVYQSQPFSIDVTFSAPDGEITSVTPSLGGGYLSVGFTTISSSVTNYTIRVSGTLTNALNATETFQFVLNDGSLTTVPLDSIPTLYKSISRWNVPPVFYNLLTNYNFNIIGTDGDGSFSESVQMSQYVYWVFQPSLTTFRAAVNGGR
jgi:hypothetical protein